MDASTPRPIRSLQFIRLPEVCKVTGLCRSAIYQLESERRFPLRVQLSPRAVGWVEVEVQAWMEERMRDRPRARLGTS